MPHQTDPIPAKQSAIIALPNGELGISNDVPVPHVDDDLVLVKTVAVAVNPVDAKMVGPMASTGAISGCDFAGIVVKIGAKSGEYLKIGDRVAGVVHPMNPMRPDIGAFAEYVGATADFTLRLPETMSLSTGASLGTGVGTMGLALFNHLQLPNTPDNPGSFPANKPCYVLVYGGSTASGTLAIQLIRHAGLTPIATCSPRSNALVESYGAEKCFDYHSPTCAKEIKAYTKNGLRYTMDCIVEADTMTLCYESIGRSGGRYTALEPYPEYIASTRKTVVANWVLGPSILGTKIGWPAPFGREGDLSLRVFGKKWFQTAQKLLDEGKIKPHPVRVSDSGFAGVFDGLELLRNKMISGEKLIYNL
ncbi:related to toxD gene [Rhynchosporium agropyri]|uniref:Related to toxD protein n=1 Tax=Rhynchosporium agropyri TaxID=914238 RepID=A0A1E1KWG5_9HELO|nr:related to toxD gene [Rhynchosporium agropyri]